jgi:hypothetical protein
MGGGLITIALGALTVGSQGIAFLGIEAGIFAAVIGATLGAITAFAFPAKPPEISFGSTGDLAGSQSYGRAGPLVTQMTNKPPVPIIYGQMRVAGNIIWRGEPIDSNSDDTIKEIIVLCQGPITSIRDIRMNDIPIEDVISTEITWVDIFFLHVPFGTDTDAMIITAYHGSSDQTSADIVGDLEGLNLRNYAYLAIEILDPDVVPYNSTFTAIVKGKAIEVYDSSTDTWGNAQYSENPAAIIRDLLLTEGGKKESDLVMDSFSEAFDYCAELVTNKDGTTEPRYRLNYALDAKRPSIDHLEDMKKVILGHFNYEGNKIKLILEKKKSVVYKFGDGSTLDTANLDNIKENSFSWQLDTIDEKPNRLILHWIDREQQYNEVTTEYNDRIDQEDKDIAIVQDYALFGIQYQNQAARMAKLLYHKSKYEIVKASFITFSEAKHLEPGDIIALTHKAALYEEKEFRIIEMRQLANEEIQLIVQEYNQYIYDDRMGVNIYTHDNPSGPNIFRPLSDVTNLTAEEYWVVNRDGKNVINADLSWTEISIAQRSRLDRYIIDYSDDGGTTYRGNYSANPGTTTFRVPDLVYNTSYIFRVRTMSKEGITSSGATTDSITMNGKTDNPPDVTGFQVNFSSLHNELVFTWNAITTIYDLEGYEIRVGGESWETSVALDTFLTGTEYKTTSFNKGTFEYFIKAIDYAGNYSTNAVSDTITITNINEENVIKNFEEWSRVSVFKLHPDQGVIIGSGDFNMTTNFDSTHFRRSLTPKTTLTWDEIDAAGYNINEADAANLSYDVWETGDVVYTTEGILLADSIVFGTLRTDYDFDQEQENGEFSLRYATSNDDITYSDFLPFVSTDINAKYAKFEATIRTNDENYFVQK